MIPLTPGFLVAAASALAGSHDLSEKRRRLAEMMLRQVTVAPDQPWDAAFVHHVGYWSHYDPHVGMSSWPMKRTGDTAGIATFAAENHLRRKKPRAGDIAIVHDPTSVAAGHPVIVVAVHEKVRFTDDRWMWCCSTVEGNTNPDGSAASPPVLQLGRWIAPVDEPFVRWAGFGYPRESEMDADAADAA